MEDVADGKNYIKASLVNKQAASADMAIGKVQTKLWL